jgi:predicted O-linked N-acetylglucosamine transferase (SPINDLY family)
MKLRFSSTTDEAQIVDLMARGEFAMLAPVARRLLGRVPDHQLGLKALAVANITSGHHDEALPLLRRGVALYPGDAEMHSNMAIVLAVTGHSGESLIRIEAAIKLVPDRAEFFVNRAATLLQLGELDAAIESCRTAIRLNPNQAEAHNTLGAALHRKRQFVAALEAFQTAARNNPESLDAFINFVMTLCDLGRFDEAATCARTVLEEAGLSQSEADALLPHVCAAERACCDWRRTDLPEALRKLMQRRADQGPEPFFMTHIENIDRATLRQGAEHSGKACLKGRRDETRASGLLAASTVDDPFRPLRIGFLSADFRRHPVSELAVGIFEALDRKDFVVHAYGYGPQDSSPLRQRLGRAFDEFRDIDALSFAGAADLMRRDRIDILVDMNGWTKFSRSGILAHSPAPVAATWLGFPGTLGVPGLAHYLISDAVVTPIDHADDYVECLALMPHSYQPSSRVFAPSVTPTRREAGLPDDAFVFCSFNQSVKITSRTFGLWCELLRRNPSTVLWLGFQSEVAQANLLHTAKEQGINSDRVVFAPWCELPSHLARLPLADLALDTFPYGSHTTGSDMLWAGVPVVARLGDTFAGRVSASVLSAAGLFELIAHTDDEYLAIADALAKDPERCQALRVQISAARATAPLFDTQRFARDFGRLFREMWRNHVAGRRGAIDLRSSDE